ncbi:PIG-L family deacetylase [Niabella insulamsoli]|uniref:PIG-L family deacetylase n=1 Tax=Niabella insulamsoli TaxID=3144874 RepID=UPI0031FDB69D
MKSLISFLFLLFIHIGALAQSTGAAQILQQIRKLKVLGSVLYVAAHPDDENTRLIAYMANDKLYRTGYLSLTRGDGGQNLIGDEQGIELGLIRTQELLAARRIDGGEQFFTRAYDFGYSKNPEETFTKWDKEKVLADVVWVIRKFQPDVIITRFPVTGEGGHGHHTASAILANEAFKAAANPAMFPEQLQYVKPWQAKRILWNTFNFGGNNTTDPSQFNVNVGGFNPLLGKSYGEIAAESRSQHKSQGFGSAASRGDSYEFFKTTGGDAPKDQLLDGVDMSWNRIGRNGAAILQSINGIEKSFNALKPEASVPALVNLYRLLERQSADHWISQKKKEVQQLIAQAAGLFIDAYTNRPFAVQTDQLPVHIVVNNRLGTDASWKLLSLADVSATLNKTLESNKNISVDQTVDVSLGKKVSQPYWLSERKEEGLYAVADQQMIGVPDAEPAYTARLLINISGHDFVFEQPVRYKHTDPVKGETYQPLIVVPPATITASPNLLVFNGVDHRTQSVQTQLHAFTNIEGHITAGLTGIDYSGVQQQTLQLNSGKTAVFNFDVTEKHAPEEVYTLTAYANKKDAKDTVGYHLALRSIDYDHIPAIRYFYPDFITSLNVNLKTAGKNVGYIPGAGDKVAVVLERMGYKVTILDETTLPVHDLSRFDAIIAGVRAYNTNEWLDEYYNKLMSYVENGGNFIVQYNTSNNLGSVKSKIGPFDFRITRNRITNEQAEVTIIAPSHNVFNFPNKITEKDFEHWIQERSIYHAGAWDKNFQALLSMADPGEAADEGSLITAKYGKGNFTYTGLVFFRELPAAVPGAMRLLANLIALNQQEK